MKKLSNKQITLLVGGIVGVVLLVFYYSTLKSERQKVTTINPAFGEYISSYSAGVLGSGATVRVILTENVIDSARIGQTADADLFSFDPKIAGSAIWLDLRTIEFRPEHRLTSGSIYEVAFALHYLMDVPEPLSVFRYSFQVVPQNFELTVNSIKPYEKADLKRQKIEGTLTTADFAEGQQVEQVLKAHQGTKNLTVSWTHAADGKQHMFIVDDVDRGEQTSIVEIQLTGTPLGIDKDETQKIEIPALGDFKITGVYVEQGASQHVVVQFSDPLLERQRLEGLLRIEGLSSIDFDIKGNEVWIYPAVRQTGTKSLYVESGIRNILDYRLPEGGSYELAFEQLKPEVRFTGKGTILPSTDGLVMPFEAVNLKAVDLTVIQIYEKNVLQFLQVNELNGNSELRRVGRPVLKKRINLDDQGIADLGKWNRFTLDLGKLMGADPGAIYQLRLSFRRSYLAYVCDEGEAVPDTPNELLGFEEDWSNGDSDEGSYWDSYESYYYNEDYDWEQRDNPCNNSYYTSNRHARRNVLASDLGLLAKRGGDGKTLVVVTDLKSTEPLSGVQLQLFDFQQQVIGSASTGPDGKAWIDSKTSPFAVIARSGMQRGYLKLNDGESLSLSNFDVGGEQIEEGLKGFLYGERGVWRPGDSLYLTFLMEDKLKKLPPQHPVVFELQNPGGQITNRLVRSVGENGFYRFATATSSEAPTGNWLGRIKVGGATFTRSLKIETVKPNRLKMNLDFGVDRLKAGEDITGHLKVNWLHGAPGRNLKAEYEVTLTASSLKFDKYPDYSFDDPSIDFYSETQSVFEGYTDDEGNADMNVALSVSETAPGLLNAVFRGKAFEDGGNFSIDRISIPYYPYPTVVGLRLPAGDKARGMLLTDTTHEVSLVTLDVDGKPVSREGLEVSIYKLEWRWWWDNAGSQANYMTGAYSTPIKSGTARTVNGKGTWKFKIEYPDWGRYLVKVSDPTSGHSAGKVVYIDWPGWAGRARDEGQGVTMLNFSSDKSVYNIGEKANLVIPGSGQGRALISIESGSKVVQTFWMQVQQGDNPFSFDVTADMAPNVFAHVTLLQPHSQTINDLPIRMYGVIPIQVENPSSHLEPQIAMPEVLEPGQEFEVRVSEKNNHKMTYTIAIVDEGLLDLTHFNTPDPWHHFYAREALGVKTWDVFNDVMGAFGNNVERLLAIGGDGELEAKADDAKANRFKPVVKFMGPFTLDGGSRSHHVTMPQYIGSVKTMLVAGYDGAYGSVERATPVRKPLMILATLPRVLGPEEKVKLPISIFTMDPKIKDVQLSVKVTGALTVGGSTRKTVSMGGESEITTDFDLVVKSETGKAKIEVTASSGGLSASDVVEISIRNPNPMITRVEETLLENGKSWEISVSPIGVAGSNSAQLEVSSLPPVNLGQRMKYLLSYPYGCVEQTTSSVFPQLYLDKVKALTADEKTRIQNNVKAGIDRLKLFVTRDGGFSYWPGGDDADSWGSIYAGHFLTEASAKGYYVPNDILKKWRHHERSRAQGWRRTSENPRGDLIQAYRLYALALAGDADLASMNRLRETNSLMPAGGWMLAAGYVLAGQPEAAKKIIANLTVDVKPYQEMSNTYGSDIRDKAIILETLVLLQDKARAFEMLKTISAALSDANHWMSTQAVAWSLKSVGSFAGLEKQAEINFEYDFNGKHVNAGTALPVAQVRLSSESQQNLKVVNTSTGLLYARVISEGIPARGAEDEASNNLHVAIEYTDRDGNEIDPQQMEQGTTFEVTVSVTNPGTRGMYKNLALTQIFPSGWEINNLRLDDADNQLGGDRADYQDIRDDRVYTYFDLGANQRKTFRLLLTAAYAGEYYLPAVMCEAMYDHSIFARKKGQVISVVKP